MRWLEIELPDNWDVQYCPMNGYNKAPLSLEEMTAAIEHPSVRLRYGKLLEERSGR
jgi:hypothetical protein